MKRLSFDVMEIEHFREIAELTVDLGAMGPGLHFVTGENRVDDRLGANGVGKTTIFADALAWVLMGKTTRGLRGPDVRSWGSKQHARIKLFFRVGKKERILERSTRTNGLSLDGKLCSQEDIYDLIRITDAILPYTLIFGQASSMFLDLKPADKMSVLSEALHLDRFENYSVAARQSVRDFDDQINDLTQQARNAENNITEAGEKLADLRERAVQWQSVSDETLNSAKKKLAGVEKAHEAAEVERGRFDLAHDNAENEARAARSNHQELVDNVSDLERKRGALEGKRNGLKVQLQELEESLNCPVCGKPMDAKHQKKESARISAEIAGLTEQTEDLTRRIKKLDKKIDAVSQSVRDFRKKADDAKDAHTRAQSAVAELRAEIAGLRAIIEQSEKQNPFTELLKTGREKIAAAKVKLKNNAAKVAELLEEREHYAYWIDGFKKLRLHLLEEFLTEVEAVAQMMLPASGLVGWTIQFRMERELKSGDTKMGLDVRCMKAGAEISPKWEAWSGGEGQRLRIVTSRALSEALLRRLGIVCDLMIFDEPTRHLSREGVADVVDLLADCADENDAQIIYIDHQAVASNRFASVQRIIKSTKRVRIASGRT